MNDMTELNAAFYKLGCACRLCIEAIADMTKAVADALTPALKVYLAKNGRVKHLALYGKKARTRKKNLHRIQREIKKGA